VELVLVVVQHTKSICVSYSSSRLSSEELFLFLRSAGTGGSISLLSSAELAYPCSLGNESCSGSSKYCAVERNICSDLETSL
jgi:hypothetical protein